MSSENDKPSLKIFCSGCSQKLDVSEFESFSSFPCPICENVLVVPKIAGDIYLTKKLSSNADFENYLALKDDKQIVVKLRKSNSDAAPIILNGMEKTLDFKPGFKVSEKNAQDAVAKMNSEKPDEVSKQGSTANDKVRPSKVKSQSSPVDKKKASEKNKKPLAKKAKKNPIKPKAQTIKSSTKPVGIKRKSKSNSSAFVILGVVAAIMLVAFVALSGGSSDKRVTNDETVAQKSEPKKKKAEIKRQQELEHEQKLVKQAEDERQQALESQKELVKLAEEKRQQELEHEQKLVKQVEEKRQQELDDFLAVISPPQEKLDIFKTLPEVSAANLKVLLKRHCVECHNTKKSKGDLNLDVFNSPVTLYRGYEIIKQGYNSVVHGDMPPDEDDISESDLNHLKTYFEKLIYTIESKPSNINNTAMIRRLTPYEYDNTVTDITGLDLKIGESFPADGSGNQGFSNDAYVMGVSPILMEKYIEAAEKISAYSVFDIKEGISFSNGDVSPPSPELFEAELKKNMYGALRDFYPVKFSVENSLPNLMKGVAEFSLNTGNRETIEVVAKRNNIHPFFLQRGVKYFSSSAGKNEIENKALKKWKSLKKGKVVDEDLNIAIKEFTEFYKSSNFFIINRRNKDRKKHISIVRNVESIFSLDVKTAAIELKDSRLTEYKKALDFYSYSRFAMNVREGKDVYAHASPLIRKFLYKVYRRPPSESELAIRVKDFLNDTLIYGMPIAARILAIREFSSLNFAFRIENKRSDKIDSYDLASRLSYFLWAGPPDTELLSIASKGELKKEEILLAQIDRMLKDKKSARLAKHFANQWLKFGGILESQGPDKNEFSGFDKELAKDMWQETAMCFNYIVKNDRSILEILDADYTIVNSRLSKIYGLNQSSSSFKKVNVNSSQRGGILGHASFLTMTSRAQRTSPITRGNWVLTTLLGATIPPPPMTVPELPEEEVVSENFTLEQQLAKHRDIAACRGCHKKIDPLGMVLENYDLVGRWRDKYSKASIVSNSKIDGMELNGLGGLKNYLLKNKVQYIRNLSKKLVSYGLGRSIYFYDNHLVNQMIENAIRNNYKFSSLVKTFVLSSQFQHK